MTETPITYHLKDIRHYYGSMKVLDIDDLEIKTGAITGLMGPNGSGKSTLLKLLAFAQKYNGPQNLNQLLRDKTSDKARFKFTPKKEVHEKDLQWKI